MLRFVFCTTLLLTSSSTLFAQPASWQQRVQYTMVIRVDTERHQMQGVQELTYTNHSPDTLREVYYHLYFNAFNPDSQMAERNRHLPDPDGRIVPRIFNLGPDEIGYHRVESLTQDGRPLRFDVFDTVLKAPLAVPLPPGASTTFVMRFHSQVPLQTRRSGRDNAEGVDFSMTQWYPKMAQYDERGWHADPYIGREFYAPFGTFDVRLTLPASYVVGATGVLMNAGEIGHGYSAEPGPATNGRDSLTWRFVAEQVHDFAWVADPEYIHEQSAGPGGVTLHLLYLPDVAETWQTYLRGGAAALIDFFSRHYGPYPYPQFTVAQGGDGGMEYPMMTLITGRRSPGSLIGVTAHEMAHMWFYGALASNEADYAWMDEGFTSYVSSEAMASLFNGNPEAAHRGAVESIRQARHYGFMDRLNTPSDWFERNSAYGIAAYSGGQALAYMLGYVISDSLLDAWWLRYFDAYKFRHPGPVAVEKTAEGISGLRLDWFFEQWLNTVRTNDYAIADLTSQPTGGDWTTTLSLERKGEIVMPLDVRLTLADGTTQWVNIPLSLMYGHKPVPDGWIVAAPWAWTFPDYTLSLSLPQRVVKAEVDPLGRMIEDNRLNNTSGVLLPLYTRFLYPPAPSSMRYGLGWRPLVTYADGYGVGFGAQLRGLHEFNQHALKASFTLWPQVVADALEDAPESGYQPSLLDALDYEAGYARYLGAPRTFTRLTLSSRRHLGNLENQLDLTRTFGGFFSDQPVNHRISALLTDQYGSDGPRFASGIWPSLLWENSHVLSAQVSYEVSKGRDRLRASVELGAKTNQRGFNSANVLRMSGDKGLRLGPLTALVRFAFQVGPESLVGQKRVILGAGSLETQWRNDAYRTLAAAFEQPLADAHIASFSGVGPVGYLAAAASSSEDSAPWRSTLTPRPSYAGGHLSVSAQPFPSNAWLAPFRLEAFSGIGTAENNREEGQLLADAGLGASFNVASLQGLNRWIRQSDVLSGLQVTARFPLWVSHPDVFGPEENAVAFRWLVGISTGL